MLCFHRVELHTRNALTELVKNTPFAGAYLRTFCHATEDYVKVESALLNISGPVEVRTSKTEGIHGNPITILETAIEDDKAIGDMISKLSEGDIKMLLDTLPKRIDDGCNLFYRLDKQQAFGGKAVLTLGEDVILVRLKIRSFPARCEIAEKSAREYLDSELKRRRAGV